MFTPDENQIIAGIDGNAIKILLPKYLNEVSIGG
jgi:hypothetical protein